MDYEPKFTGEGDEEITFQIEEGLLTHIADSTLSIEQATLVADMLEDNAGFVPEGNELIWGGKITIEGEDDVLFEVEYDKPEDGIPTYFVFRETETDTYLDHM